MLSIILQRPNPPGGMGYAIKGIFGGYRGYFSIMPYYIALQKYSRLESRDIWEYKLNLTEEESIYLLEHLWEMGDVWMDYFFFTENCSYNLLTILEVVKPGYEFVQDFTMKVIPIETVREVQKYPELIDTLIFRPALLTSFNYKLSQLNPSQKALLKFMYKNSKKESANRSAASSEYTRLDSTKVYDVWLDLIQYRKRKSKNKIKKEKITRLQREILVTRSKFKQKNEFKPEWVTRPADPLERHKPSIIHLGAGRYRSRKFLELGSGMLNYDLNSLTRGTSGNMDIKYLDFKLRLYTKKKSDSSKFEYDNYHLESFKILEIKSLEPSRYYISHVSWHFLSGFDSPKISNNVFRNSLMIQAGAGKTYSLPGALGMIYSLVELKVRLAPWMANYHSIGPEWRSGLKINFTHRASLLGKYILFNPLTGESYRESILNLQLRLSPTQQSEIIFEDTWHNKFRQLQLSFNYYL